jgi:23S rRNA (uracil1939-C5)-methyltransferase
MTEKYPVSRNQEMELAIEKLAFGGKGLTRLNEYVIFVERTLPGDRIKARIIKRRPNYAEAKLLEIIKPSPLRITAPCPYFGECGGCTWQNLAYTDQLKFKQEHVRESLQQLAGIADYDVKDPIPATPFWGYRNKMEFSFSDRRWFSADEKSQRNEDSQYVLGLHVNGTYDKILNVDHCLLQNDCANKVLSIVDKFCTREKLPAYSMKSHEGYLRFLVIRHSVYTGEIMVVLVTSSRAPERLKPLADELVAAIPQITSIVNTINTRPAQIAYGEETVVIAGKDHLVEKIDGLIFKISAHSFFQTNSHQAQALYKTVLEYADLDNSGLVWDLYSGTGTISLLAARHTGRVVGFELVQSAVQDAIHNSLQNGLSNVSYISGDILANIEQVEELPQVVITDPPRSGMHSRICDFLNTCGAKKIIYVSCNPATMARDIKQLTQNYRLKRVQPVDMFPHTFHIETVCELLSR